MSSVQYAADPSQRLRGNANPRQFEEDDCCDVCCHKCVTRVPYATLVAIILNWAGVGVFCGTLYRGVNLTLRVLQDVFQLDRGLGW